MDDLVAVWEIKLSDGLHHVEFEHGTTTGKRVVRVDHTEILRKDWMFKLVGQEKFAMGKANFVITISAHGTFAYEYQLEVNGKSYKKFSENQSKLLMTWGFILDSIPTRVCLEKDTMDIFCNGRKMEAAGEFTDDGTETHFEIGEHVCYVKTTTSGKRRTGIVHNLFVDNKVIDPDPAN